MWTNKLKLNPKKTEVRRCPSLNEVVVPWKEQVCNFGGAPGFNIATEG